MIHKKIKCKMRNRMILVLVFIFFQNFDKLSIFAIFRKNKSPIYRGKKKSDNIGKKRKSNISIFSILAKKWRYQTLFAMFAAVSRRRNPSEWVTSKKRQAHRTSDESRKYYYTVF